MDNNFTFSNPIIKDYFEGKSEFAPVGELVYLHNHPLITPNFLTELDQIFLKAGELIKKRNLQGKVVEDIFAIGLKIGQTLPDVTYDTAPILLAEFRKLYKLSLNITGMLG